MTIHIYFMCGHGSVANVFGMLLSRKNAYICKYASIIIVCTGTYRLFIIFIYCDIPLLMQFLQKVEHNNHSISIAVHMI